MFTCLLVIVCKCACLGVYVIVVCAFCGFVCLLNCKCISTFLLVFLSKIAHLNELACVFAYEVVCTCVLPAHFLLVGACLILRCVFLMFVCVSMSTSVFV